MDIGELWWGLGYQRGKFHFLGIRGLKKARNLGNQVTGHPKFQDTLFLNPKYEFTNQLITQEPNETVEPINPKSTRVIKKVSQSISCAQQQMQS